MNVTKYNENVMRVARKIVRKISNSLQQEWYGFDDDERDEIEKDWANEIAAVLKKADKNRFDS